MGIQKSKKAVETDMLPSQTMQIIVLQDWFSLIGFSVLLIIFSCSTKIYFVLYFCSNI